jgi:hypothetical protein
MHVQLMLSLPLFKSQTITSPREDSQILLIDREIHRAIDDQSGFVTKNTIFGPSLHVSKQPTEAK